MMQKVVMMLMVLVVAVVGAQPPSLRVDAFDLHRVVASAATLDGREALRLVAAEGKRVDGMALLKAASFTNGSIEVDVAGRKTPQALPDDRGFIGVAFRVRSDAETYECIYIRPDNGRALDQVRRNHSTQYVSHPAYTFARLRKEAPERYESYVDLEAGGWTRLRIEVAGSSARLFVHEAPQPALVVTDLKLGTGGGGVGLWIGSGTEGYFSRLIVRGQ